MNIKESIELEKKNGQSSSISNSNLSHPISNGNPTEKTKSVNSQIASGPTNTQQKDIKDMSDKELANHYKSLFLKSKKLIVHYEEELKQLKANIFTLKDRLKEYESGKHQHNIIYYINLN